MLTSALQDLGGFCHTGVVVPVSDGQHSWRLLPVLMPGFDVTDVLRSL